MVEMERKRKLAGLSQVIVLCLLAAGTAAQTNKPEAPASTPPQDQIGYKSAAGAEQKKTLLLKDFKPKSMLHTTSHSVDWAKYYVIDVHNHVNDAQGMLYVVGYRTITDVSDLAPLCVA